MKSNVLPDWVKFIIVCVWCGLGGFLTSYIGGQFVDSLTIVEKGAIIAVGGGAIYAAVFRGLQLERVLYPRAAVITEAQKSVAAQIGLMSHDTIAEATDPMSTTVIAVTAQRQETTTPINTSVIPKG
jgi:hypothetical protein